MIETALLGAPWWEGWKPASCLPAGCFCEGIRAGFIRQPANTASAAAFLLVAGWVVWRAARDAGGAGGVRLALGRGYPFAFALALILLGLSTAFYHASLTFVGQLADNFGMHLLASLILLGNVARHRPLDPHRQILGYLAINALLALLVVLAAPPARRFLFGGVLAAAGTAEFLGRRSNGPHPGGFLYGSLALLGLAFGLWLLDNTGAVCTPYSVLQGHAVWHLLTAAAAALLFQYYRAGAPLLARAAELPHSEVARAA